ncbi:hypothetical protein PRK78_006025 [Emydomyces testavorans]|uniref:Leucine Rich Repeat domain protein n=1 Tax=Emydomyces testavorans TaxID=2070801 RepID=A0AAF0IKI3_9EURO|nr:hypothetical protein PRK78_006025 [Emydomyces testavorans]
MDPGLPSPFEPRSQRNHVALTPANVPNSPFQFVHRSTRLSLDKLSGPPSSDPPLFSSDDFQPGLENYTSGAAQTPAETGDNGAGRKRRYRGTWWGEKVHSKKQRRRTGFKSKRDLDSGVWMMSSDDSAGLLSSDLVIGGDDDHGVTEDGKERKRQPEVAEGRSLTNPVLRDVPQLPMMLPIDGATRTFLRTDRVAETEAQRHARSATNRCLEEGCDNVDLSHLGLEAIAPSIIQSLKQLTKQPPLKDAPLSEAAYGPLEPFLRLYLAKNRLTSLPRDIFELQELKLLSLRQNKLKEIPCAIRKLTKLQDLNLAVNRLEYLPWELLGLMQTGDLKRLTVHPNPFMPLHEADIIQWHWGLEDGDASVSERLKRTPYFADPNSPTAWLPLHIATGTINYLDMEGRPLNPKDQQHTIAQRRTRAPSLRELSLRACVRTWFFRSIDLDANDDEDAESPTSVRHLLQLAKLVNDSGGRRCSVCGREYIIPRAEWVEWWDCLPYENGSKMARVGGQRLWPLPFLRRGCSWGCGLVIGEGE